MKWAIPAPADQEGDILVFTWREGRKGMSASYKRKGDMWVKEDGPADMPQSFPVNESAQMYFTATPSEEWNATVTKVTH